MSTARFALAPVPNREGGAASRSHVLFDNKQTGLVLEGTVLARQYETYSGFLLWLTCDEQLSHLNGESLQIYLVSPGVTVLDVRSLRVSSFSAATLENLFKTGDDVFQFTFLDRWQLSVRKTPRFQIIRRAYEWGESGTPSIHHTAFFAHRYLELERVRQV